MMHVGVVSDTHGLLRPEVIRAFQGVGLILHAGDIGDPVKIIKAANCGYRVNYG